MKRIIKFTTGLSLQILLLGLIGFFGTFFSEYISSVGGFGDSADELGARHYWYNWTVTLLFLIQIARILIWTSCYWDKELNDELNNRR